MDITGYKSGKLTAISICAHKNKHGQRLWLCECECGNIFEILQHSLTSGNSTKCKLCPRNEYLLEDNYALLDVSTKTHINKYSKVDVVDLSKILKCRRRWSYHDSAPDYTWGKYVINSDRKVRLHRLIMDAPTDMVVDHINGDTLDNRKQNLKIITLAENNKNMRQRVDNISGVSGVYYEKSSGLYVAEIQVNNKKIYLGRYNTLLHAKIAREGAQKVLGFSNRHGTF